MVYIYDVKDEGKTSDPLLKVYNIHNAHSEPTMGVHGVCRTHLFYFFHPKYTQSLVKEIAQVDSDTLHILCSGLLNWPCHPKAGLRL